MSSNCKIAKGISLFMLLLGIVAIASGIFMIVAAPGTANVTTVEDPVITTEVFGIIMVVNLAIGFVTPPVGVNLFVTSGVSGVPVLKLAKHALPFIGTFLIALLFITFIPEISLLLLG